MKEGYQHVVQMTQTQVDNGEAIPIDSAIIRIINGSGVATGDVLDSGPANSSPAPLAGASAGSVTVIDDDTFATASATNVASAESVKAYVDNVTNGVQNNLAGAVAPAVGDDSAAGYSVGSHWIDEVLDEVYVCVDSAVGAAIWIETSGGGSNPTKGDIDALGVDAATVSGLTVETAVPVGALFTDTVYSHPATHTAAEITDLQTVIDASVPVVIDDDTMATASATNVASAESTKAYVDANAAGGAVTSVAGRAGVVTLVEADITDLGTYETADVTILKDADVGVAVQGYDINTVVDAAYVATEESYTTVDSTKVGFIAVTQAVDLDSMETDVAANVADRHAASTLGTKTVDETGMLDGQVLTYNTTSGNMEWETSSTGVTDHTLLSAIGANSHAIIDTFISSKGSVNGLADLDATGKVPAGQLPSYVDDVVEYANEAAFPATGATGVLYLAIDTNGIFRWTGTVYVEVSPTVGAPVSSVNTQIGDVILDSDNVSEGTVNKYTTVAQQATIGYLTVNQAVDLDAMETVSHSASTLGTRVVDETGMADGQLLSYNGTSGDLEYVTPDVVPALIDDDTLATATAINVASAESTKAYVDSAAGGLARRGVLPASVTLQGLFAADGANGAASLYAATGSQDRVMIVAASTHNGTLISVQAGESLNGVANDSYTTQDDGEVLLFIDNEVGNWTMKILGAGDPGESVVSLVDLSDITATGASYIQGTNPTTGQVAVHNDGTATLTRIGDKAIVTMRVTLDDDDTITLTLGTSIVPTGGKILALAINGFHRWDQSYMTVYSSANTLVMNRETAINSDITTELTFMTDGWDELSQQLMAGGLVPTVLDDDSFVTATADTLASSESIKAYVDDKGDIVSPDGTNNITIGDDSVAVVINGVNRVLGDIDGTRLNSAGNTAYVSVDDGLLKIGTSNVDKIYIDGSKTDIISPDNTTLTTYESTAINTKVSGTVRASIDGTISKMISPDGLSNISINNTSTLMTMGATNRVDVGTANTTLRSPTDGSSIALEETIADVTVGSVKRLNAYTTGTSMHSSGNLSSIDIKDASSTTTINGSTRILIDSAKSRITGPNTSYYLDVDGGQVWSHANFAPSTDNTYGIGMTSFRWTEVWAVNGTIQTSDENLKKDVKPLDVAEKAVSVKLRGLIKTYKWKDDSDTKIHTGIIAQEVVAAFASEGLDAHDYAMIRKEDNSYYGVNYTDLMMFILATV